MYKTYTLKNRLYIHDDRFADEKEKSKLVNDLLARHYTRHTLPSKKEYIEAWNKGAKNHLYVPQIKAPRDDTPVEFCKHNAVKGFCKKGCK